MNKVIISLLFIGLLPSATLLSSAVQPSASAPQISETPTAESPDPDLKQAAFDILKAKCNVCHKKKNPFKVFSLKNMDKHAKRIYKQVFVFKRMPKGDEIKLTEEEYQTLKNWLHSKNTF